MDARERRQARLARQADPLHQHLTEVRRGLLRLHKTLIDAERAAFEDRTGPMSNTQFLGALLEEPFFAWLRPYSGLVARIDEALAGEEAMTDAQAKEFLEQARALVAPAGTGTEGARRYEMLRQREPNVLVAHVELVRRLAAPPEAAPGAA